MRSARPEASASHGDSRQQLQQRQQLQRASNRAPLVGGVAGGQAGDSSTVRGHASHHRLSGPKAEADVEAAKAKAEAEAEAVSPIGVPRI